jgi:hypothetical protein
VTFLGFIPTLLVDRPIFITYLLVVATIIMVADTQAGRHGVRSTEAALTTQALMRRDFMAASNVITIPLYLPPAEAGLPTLQSARTGVCFAQ